MLATSTLIYNLISGSYPKFRQCGTHSSTMITSIFTAHRKFGCDKMRLKTTEKCFDPFLKLLITQNITISCSHTENHRCIPLLCLYKTSSFTPSTRTLGLCVRINSQGNSSPAVNKQRTQNVTHIHIAHTLPDKWKKASRYILGISFRQKFGVPTEFVNGILQFFGLVLQRQSFTVRMPRARGLNNTRRPLYARGAHKTFRNFPVRGKTSSTRQIVKFPCNAKTQEIN